MDTYQQGLDIARNNLGLVMSFSHWLMNKEGILHWFHNGWCCAIRRPDTARWGVDSATFQHFLLVWDMSLWPQWINWCDAYGSGPRRMLFATFPEGDSDEIDENDNDDTITSKSTLPSSQDKHPHSFSDPNPIPIPVRSLGRLALRKTFRQVLCTQCCFVATPRCGMWGCHPLPVSRERSPSWIPTILEEISREILEDPEKRIQLSLKVQLIWTRHLSSNLVPVAGAGFWVGWLGSVSSTRATGPVEGSCPWGKHQRYGKTMVFLGHCLQDAGFVKGIFHVSFSTGQQTSNLNSQESRVWNT